MRKGDFKIELHTHASLSLKPDNLEAMEVSQAEIKARTRHQILASETIHNWPNHADQTVNKAASGRSSRSPVGPTVRKKSSLYLVA